MQRLDHMFRLHLSVFICVHQCRSVVKHRRPPEADWIKKGLLSPIPSLCHTDGGSLIHTCSANKNGRYISIANNAFCIRAALRILMPGVLPTLALLHEQTLLRHAVARSINELGRYTLIAEAADAAAFKRAVAVGALPELLIVSLDVALANSSALLHWMVQHVSSARILVLGTCPPPAVLLNLLCWGAHGFLQVEQAHERLCLALEHIHQHALHFPDLPREQLRALRPPMDEAAQQQLHEPITERQAEFLRLVTTGLPYATIAKRMDVSVSRVNQYRDALCERFGVVGKAGLVRLAFLRGSVA